MEKRFKIKASDIKVLAEGYGYGLATNRITVDGMKVGYMYREGPDNDTDSGWRFFSGDESDDYVNDPANVGLYEINTIANYDPGIIPFLDAEIGSQYERNPYSDSFLLVED